MAVATKDKLLSSITETFQLSKSEMGRLFGVSRQAIAEWEQHGIPVARQPKATVVAAIGDLLSHQLKPERIPGIARRRAPAYGNRTMLEMIAADQHEELLAITRRSFDWARTA